MDRPLLNDKNEYPNDDVLLKYLNKTKKIWDEFVTTISSDFPAMSLEWNYYNDGKSWLCKLVYKKKTMCWISVWDKFFKVTFYFTEKNDMGIKNLKIDQSLKEAYYAHKNNGRLKPLRVEIKTKKMLKNIYELIKYKR